MRLPGSAASESLASIDSLSGLPILCSIFMVYSRAVAYTNSLPLKVTGLARGPKLAAQLWAQGWRSKTRAGPSADSAWDVRRHEPQDGWARLTPGCCASKGHDQPGAGGASMGMAGPSAQLMMIASATLPSAEMAGLQDCRYDRWAGNRLAASARRALSETAWVGIPSFQADNLL